MIKGVLFDKDGTLIDFCSLWVSAAVWSVGEIVRLNKLPIELTDYILDIIGVEGENIKPNGALAFKVYEDIAKDICDGLATKNFILDSDNLTKQMVFYFEQYVLCNDVNYTEIAALEPLLLELKGMGVYTGVATADTKDSTVHCLQQLKLDKEFNYIGTDDGAVKPKPQPDMIYRFMDLFSLDAQEVMMVGDTYNDIRFARNGGAVAVGVLSGASNADDFKGEADYIVSSVAEIPNLIKKINNNI